MFIDVFAFLKCFFKIKKTKTKKNNNQRNKQRPCFYSSKISNRVRSLNFYKKKTFKIRNRDINQSCLVIFV